MRLIDADAAAELMDHMLDEGYLNMRDPAAVRYNVRLMLTEEYYTPTIDPVKHGRWITTEYNDGSVLCECSYCGHARPRDGLPINYCHNCGARMER